MTFTEKDKALIKVFSQVQYEGKSYGTRRFSRNFKTKVVSVVFEQTA